MATLKCSFPAIVCLIFILIQCGEASPGLITSKFIPKVKDTVSKYAEKIVKDTSKVFQSPLTRKLCEFKTVNNDFDSE